MAIMIPVVTNSEGDAEVRVADGVPVINAKVEDEAVSDDEALS